MIVFDWDDATYLIGFWHVSVPTGFYCWKIKCWNEIHRRSNMQKNGENIAVQPKAARIPDEIVVFRGRRWLKDLNRTFESQRM
jgi:hypothetical protein